MFVIWPESLTSFSGDNANNLDFDHPQGWERHLEARD
jgi:hypothetical protein